MLDYKKLRKHIGHNLVCVGYALQDLDTGEPAFPPQNVAIECEDCNEVLIDFEAE